MSKRNDIIYFETTPYHSQVVIAGGRLKLPYELLWVTWAAIAGIAFVWGVLWIIIKPYSVDQTIGRLYNERFEGFIPLGWMFLATLAAIGIYWLGRLIAWWIDTIKAAL